MKTYKFEFMEGKRKGGRTHRFFMLESEFSRMDENSEGLCLGCGAVRGMCEPDAEKYTCEACGGERVYGAYRCLEQNWISFDRKFWPRALKRFNAKQNPTTTKGEIP